MGKSTTKSPAANAEPDRSHYAEGEEYPIRELAVATGISVDEAEALIAKHGVSNGKAAEAARDMQRDQMEEEQEARS